MGGPATIDGEPIPSTDNFLIAPMDIDGQTFPSCEHFYQCTKFAPELDSTAYTAQHVEAIRQTPSGMKAWQMGQSRRAALRPDFEEVKASLMYRGVAAKFVQYPAFAAELLATGHGHIRGAPSTADWQYVNGLILERVREELRPPTERNEKRLAALVKLTSAYKAEELKSTDNTERNCDAPRSAISRVHTN
mmetsp:Transcript_11342/g.18996  ORF Transcript_11342/g.18996 Transcript_11342/m.18996 type:complete len:191 (-) Transcript_11342:226-798(-)|eukprot:CAMPEP_0119309750 /NCGR_PEP_ID=MMETSP1333-20130426/16438_1 /TAXON_ID=418940 /ORGANISM="Scyphosphaera apsteinii, Strain RCC1455" /LENGTH=190 /DNA_ID=CAMNT_0007313769 /DNA_START=70 /DNA_END=642 /DNA_ORIENTATION=+